jgi:putative hydrolase of the HAD superfamily
VSGQVVTFDAGHVIIALDLAFLSRRLGERGLTITAGALDRALPGAWTIYDREVAAGVGHPWHALMTALVVGAGVAADQARGVVEWLWSEQPAHNLWREPIVGMVALARELAARGVRVVVLSNSEGRLAELLAEIGVADAFEAIIDSGRVGIAKPDPRIFAIALAAVGVDAADASAVAAAAPIHIGDSWAADVVGALGAGWRAIWYGDRIGEANDPRIAAARDPAAARAALVAWGVL